MTHSNATAPAVQATRLGKRFGRQWALAHCDLRVEAGEILLLAGANGSGKTTLLRLIAGLYKRNAGDLRIFGSDPEKERLTCRRSLTMVSHENYLYDRLTPMENLRIWSRIGSGAADDGHLISLLSEVGLEDRQHHPVGGFSAGMRKRLTLLRTRLEEPRLVLLDEPFSALDPEGQRLVEQWISRFKTNGSAVILASHDLPRSARICDRAVLMNQGQVTWTGTGTELQARLEAEA